jgi:hypothetical protein
MHMGRATIVLASALLLGLDVDPTTAAEGLKEALRVGTRGAVALVSRKDGFYADPGIRIPLPGAMKDMARGLRRIGFKAQIEEFELALNRAAESAAGEAFDVFAAAIGEMSIPDARALLGGGDTAATAYLERTSSDELGLRFAPIVEKSMAKTGVVAIYDRLLQHWKAMPPGTKPDLDLDEYVTRETLDGLFLKIGEQERRIRTDPAARSGELLQRVFGPG